MRTVQGDRLSVSNWWYVSLPVLVLLGCLFYNYAAAYLAPYPGLDWGGPKWTVDALESCDVDRAWCEANRDSLRVGDEMLVIGDLDRADYYAHGRDRIPFDGYNPGEMAPITFVREGKERTTSWQMLGPTGASRAYRLAWGLVTIPFWLTGTFVLLHLQPHDSRWRLLVAFNYVTAIWLAAGVYSRLGVAYASLVAHALTWIGTGILLHLHLAIPTPLLDRHRRYFLPPLYALATVLAFLELFQVLPSTAFNLGFLVAFVGSVGTLAFRVLFRRCASDRLAARLMLVGIGLTIGPGVVLWVVPLLLNATLPARLTMNVVMSAIPLLPLFYVYAIYKRQLGVLEFRANRLLSGYSFFLSYASVSVMAFLAASRWLQLPEGSVVLGLMVSAVFAITAIPLYARFRHLVDRLAYGTRYDPDDIIHVFASRIPASLSLNTLCHLLADEVVPSLLIRQSTLLLLADGEPRPLYMRGVDPDLVPTTSQQIQQLLSVAGRYRPPLPGEAQHEFAWVRLAIPLETRGMTMGVWLFGRRDPDDFYPRSDVSLLNTLACQVAMAAENGQLYNRAQEEIAERRRVEEALRQYAEQLRAMSARLAEAEEIDRKQIARELHDQVGQNLTALGINLNILRRYLPGDADLTRSCLNDSLALVKQTTKRIRDVMADLRPSVLDDYGLVAALRWHGKMLASKADITITVDGDTAELLLPSTKETALFRIAQEALTNVVKHARAASARVTLEIEEETVRLTIVDDGMGFKSEDIDERGTYPRWGLLTMRERAEAVGGSCYVESSPEKGTRVTVEVKR